MKIISCHIDAFGKLNNVDVKFNESLNSVCQENGFGKTTLAMFIKAMFFGFDNSRKKMNDRVQYQPLSQGNYGGTLTFETEKGKFKIIRSFKSTLTKDTFEIFNAETNLPSKIYSENLGEEIFGVGKETFDATIFFAQNDLASEVNDGIKASLVGNISSDDMGAYSVAIRKLKEKKLELNRELKTINLEYDQRLLRENKLREENIKEKINFSNEDIKVCEENIVKINTNKENLKELQNKLDNYRSEKKALEILIDDKSKELEKLRENIEKQKLIVEQKNNNKKQKIQENNEKINKNKKKNNYFLIISIIMLILSIISMSVYFAVNNIILIVIFAIFLVSFGILFTLYFVKRNKNGINEFIENDNFVEEELLKNLKKDEVLKLGEIKDKEQDLQNLNRQFQNEFGLTEREFIERLEHNDNILKRYESQKVTSETNLKHYQNEFEKVETYVQELEDKLNEDTENYDKLKKNLDIIEKTEEFLQISSENLSKRYVEPVQKKFDEFYKKFFVNDKIVFNTNLNSLIEQSLQEDGYLSAGTLDLVNICKRFALIDLLYKKEKPFIILDDPFINLDDKNLKVAKEIVMEEAKKYQIIFLTCHSSRQL